MLAPESGMPYEEYNAEREPRWGNQMFTTWRGATARLLAGGVSAALAVSGLSLLAAPAHAVPVNVTGILTDHVGNALDGYVDVDVLGADGLYTSLPDRHVADGVINMALEPGTYKFRFVDVDRLFVSEYYSDKATFDTADPVVVAGPVALAPVALAPAPALTGQVLAPNGSPIEGTEVTAYKADAAPGSGYVAYADTRADGTFALPTGAGSFKIRVKGHRGYASEWFNNKPDQASADVVAVGPGGANVGAVTLTRGAVVTGRVTNDAGVPLERVAVEFEKLDGSWPVVTDYTDAAGIIRAEDVPAGTYKVRFRDPVGEYLSEWFNNKSTKEDADVVTVGVEGEVAGLNAALSPDPANVVDPAKVLISGTVVDSAGAPVIGAQVDVFDTPTDGDRPETIEWATTNRAGQYFVKIDEYEPITSETGFKIRVTDDLPREEGQFSRLSRWFNSAQSYAGATEVTTPASNVNLTLPLTGGISGTVTSEANLPVYGVDVRIFDESGNVFSDAGASVKDDGTYATTNLMPGKYKVQFFEYGSNGDSWRYGDRRAHAPEWYDNTTFAKAKVITVKSGQMVTGINAALSRDLRALSKPRILGKPYLGGKIRATSGAWSLESGTTFQYQWLVDGAVVGTGSVYRVRKADKSERITLRVLAENDGLTGTALIQSQQIGKQPKVKVKVTGAKAALTVKVKKVKAKKIKGNVVAKLIKRLDEYGVPVYKTIGKAKLKNGKASLGLKKLKKGKNKLVFFVSFKGKKIGDAQVSKKVKIKR